MASTAVRESYIKARLYRLFATMFAVGGLVMFFYIYVREVEGHLFRALQDPMLVLMVLLPFMPAVVLSFLAQKHERRLEKALKDKK